MWNVDVCEAKEIKRVEIAYEGHTNKVSCIDFSGHHLITGSWDQTIRYHTPTHTRTHSTRTHTHNRTTHQVVLFGDLRAGQLSHGNARIGGDAPPQGPHPPGPDGRLQGLDFGPRRHHWRYHSHHTTLAQDTIGTHAYVGPGDGWSAVPRADGLYSPAQGIASTTRNSSAPPAPPR